MVRSRLPLPSLFGLFGALLMRSPEVLLDELTTILSVNPELQIPLAIAVEHYNQEVTDSDNYYKAFEFMASSQYEDSPWLCKYLKVTFVETTCKKDAPTLYYKRIQKCERIPGNHEEILCYFSFSERGIPDFQMKLGFIDCL